MSAARLLERLDGVRETGAGRWIALCKAHEDKRPSLSIRELEDGRTLVKCWAGCDAPDIVTAVGMTLADLFPAREQRTHNAAPVRRPFSASDALQCLDFEAWVLQLAAGDLAHGELSDESRERLTLAARRIHAAREVCHG